MRSHPSWNPCVLTAERRAAMTSPSCVRSNWGSWSDDRDDRGGVIGWPLLSQQTGYQNRTLPNAQTTLKGSDHCSENIRLDGSWWASEFHGTKLRQNQTLCPKENWRRETRSRTSRSHRGSSEPWRLHLFCGFGDSTGNIHDSVNFYILCFTMFPLQFWKASSTNEAFRLQFVPEHWAHQVQILRFYPATLQHWSCKQGSLNKGSTNWQGCTTASLFGPDLLELCLPFGTFSVSFFLLCCFAWRSLRFHRFANDSSVASSSSKMETAQNSKPFAIAKQQYQ